jgi:hypothetical protein
MTRIDWAGEIDDLVRDARKQRDRVVRSTKFDSKTKTRARRIVIELMQWRDAVRAAVGRGNEE